MPELISMIFGTLQHHFILNIFVDSKFIKFIVQSGATWRKLTIPILLSANAKGSSMFSRISLDNVQNKIDCSSVLKDGKTLEAIHSRFEHHHCKQTLCLLAV